MQWLHLQRRNFLNILYGYNSGFMRGLGLFIFEPPSLGQTETLVHVSLALKCLSQSVQNPSWLWNQPNLAGTYRWVTWSSHLDPFGPKFTFLHIGAFTNTIVGGRFHFSAIPGIIQTSHHMLLQDQGSPPRPSGSCFFTVILSAAPCGFVWSALPSSLGDECIWLMNCCWSHLSGVRYPVLGHSLPLQVEIPPSLQNSE